MIDEYDGVAAALADLATGAPGLSWERLRAARQRARRRARIRAGTGALAGAVLVGVAGVSLAAPGASGGHATLGVQSGPVPSPRTRMSATRPGPENARPGPVNARPSTAPPTVRTVDLGLTGSHHAIRGVGWSLNVLTNSTRAVRLEVDGARGQSTGAIIGYPASRGEPLTGLVGDAVATLDGPGGSFSVAFGGVPRGTAGVAVLDSAGRRGWATLIEPGSSFDRLLYAYEPAHGASVVAIQSFSADGRRTDNRLLTPVNPAAVDPGQQAAAGLLRIERPVDPGNPAYQDLCLVIVATGQRSCDEDPDSTGALVEMMRLPDGRLAIGGRVAQGDISVSLEGRTTPMHRLTLGLLAAAPAEFLWVGEVAETTAEQQARPAPSNPIPSGSAGANCMYEPFPAPVDVNINRPGGNSYRVHGPKLAGIISGERGRLVCGPSTS